MQHGCGCLSLPVLFPCTLVLPASPAVLPLFSVTWLISPSAPLVSPFVRPVSLSVEFVSPSAPLVLRSAPLVSPSARLILSPSAQLDSPLVPFVCISDFPIEVMNVFIPLMLTSCTLDAGSLKSSTISAGASSLRLTVILPPTLSVRSPGMSKCSRYRTSV